LRRVSETFTNALKEKKDQLRKNGKRGTKLTSEGTSREKKEAKEVSKENGKQMERPAEEGQSWKGTGGSCCGQS